MLDYSINSVFITFLCFIAFTTSSFANQNISVAQENLEVFDRLCVQNLDDLSNIGRIMNVMGGKKLSENVLAADPALRNGGVGYSFESHGRLFMVSHGKDAYSGEDEHPFRANVNT